MNQLPQERGEDAGHGLESWADDRELAQTGRRVEQFSPALGLTGHAEDELPSGKAADVEEVASMRRARKASDMSWSLSW